MTIGIYCIKNGIDGKRYIGQSKDIWKRFNNHISSLDKGNHRNIHLQRAWNLNGKSSFDFTLLKVCSIEELDTLESQFISQYDTMNDKYGYNFEGGGNRNKVMSVETRRKISESRKGKSFMSPEYLVKLSERMKGKQYGKGKKMSKENNQKLHQVVNKGNKYTLGYKHTEENKKKFSEIRKGNKFRLGIPHSDEVKKRISESLKATWKRNHPTTED